METLLEHLRNNNNILECPKCKKDLYKFNSSVQTGGADLIRAKDFEPVNFDIPKPLPNTEMRCPFCQCILAYVDRKKILDN